MAHLKRVRIIKKIRESSGVWRFISLKKNGERYVWDKRPGYFFLEWWEGKKRKRQVAGQRPTEAIEAQRRKRNELVGELITQGRDLPKAEQQDTVTPIAKARERQCQVNGGRRQSMDGITVSTPPLSTRDHQPCRLAVPSVHAELPRRGGPSRGAWHHRILRSHSILVPEVRTGVRPHSAEATGSPRRHLARGRGVHHDPRRTSLSLEGGGPGWRCPRYPGHTPPRQESCQALLSQGLEAPGEATAATCHRQTAKLSGCAPRDLPIRHPSNRAIRK